MNYRDAAEYTIARFSLPESVDEVICDWIKMSEQAYRFEITLKPYAAEYLHQLKSKESVWRSLPLKHRSCTSLC